MPFKKRIELVKVDRQDIWNADYTLALIIYPVLKKLKESKQGAPFVDDDDVPDSLKAVSAPPKENEWDTDKFWFDRWDYVLNEMLFAFHCILNEGDIDFKVYETYEPRITNGLRLFGKYYRALWT